MEHGHSLVILPHFDGNNYAYWKVRVKAFLKSIDETVWNSIEYGWEKPTTPVSEWQTSQKEAAAFNSKVMNVIFNVVSIKEFKRISNVGVLFIHPKINKNTKGYLSMSIIQKIISYFRCISHLSQNRWVLHIYGTHLL